MPLKNKGVPFLPGAPSSLDYFFQSLTFDVITLIEPFNPAGGIHHTPFAGEEWMAITAHFHS
jgi:hypothetical protein